jgi:NAD(P)-dependent dehydrogenase (short-subunit alcohol dehydrogenase family)
MAVPNRTETKDGFESQFGVNYLAHYVLTALLIPTLLSSSTPDCNSRLISVTSSGHGFSPVRFQDTYLKNDYDPWIAYGQSKTGNIWMANYIDRKYGPLGLHANSVHPGVVATGIAHNLSPEAAGSLAENSVLARQMKTPAQGAATAVWAAVADALGGLGGEFLVDCGLGVPAENAGDIADEGFASHAFDREGEDRLWELSKELTGVDVEA